MADYKINRVCGVYLSLTGDYSLNSGYTDHTEAIGYDGKTFLSAPEVDFSKIATLTSGFDDEECIVKNIPAPSTDTLMSRLRVRYPYSEVAVDIYSWKMDDEEEIDLVNDVWHLWSGLLYETQGHLLREYVSIESRNEKYYTDRVAGITCVEQCKCGYFGDAICGKAVTSQSVTIDSIDGYDVTFSVAPAGVDKLYRCGYLSYQGLDIKILNWESATGTQATTALPCPSDWLNATVAIYAGCDKTYESCRDIHDNTEKGLFLGINMVDYSTLYEEE